MRLIGLSGLQDVYGSSPSELSRYDEQALRERGLTGGQVGENIGLTAAYNPNISAWDRVAQVGGAVAGGVSGIAGIGNSRGPRSRPRPQSYSYEAG